VLYALFISLLLNCHYFAIVAFASQFLIFLVVIVFFKRSARLITGGLAAGVLSGLSLLHWLPVIMQDLQITNFHVQPVEPLIVFDFAWSYIRDPIAFAVYSVCVFFGIRALIHALRARHLKMTHAVILGWLVLGFMIPLVYSLVKLSLMTTRYNTIIVPSMLILISYGFQYFSSKVRSYLITLIFVSGFILLFIARPIDKPRRAEDWREVGQYFARTDNSNVNRVVFSQLAWFHDYYFKQFKTKPPFDQNVANFDSLIEGPDHVWLLQNTRYTGGWPVNGFLPVQKEVIDREYVLSDSVTFRQTTALLFERKRKRIQ
jgi:hypothetical protein